MISHSIFRVAVLLLLSSGSIQVLAQVTKPSSPPAADRSAGTLGPVASSTTGGQKKNPSKGAQAKTKSRQTYVPLSASQKLFYGARNAFLDPSAYLGPAVDAYFVERRDVKALGKTFEDKFADGATHYARSFGTASLTTFMSSGVYPVLFKQDPRYHLSGKHGFMSRALYAASRTVITRGDNGQLQPNYSRLAGTLTSAALTNSWERDLVKVRSASGVALAFRRRVGVEPTLKNFGISTAVNAGSNIAFHEFDVLGKLIKLIRKR